MFNCDGCGHEISGRDEICPSCGKRVEFFKNCGSAKRSTRSNRNASRESILAEAAAMRGEGAPGWQTDEMIRSAWNLRTESGE